MTLTCINHVDGSNSSERSRYNTHGAAWHILISMSKKTRVSVLEPPPHEETSTYRPVLVENATVLRENAAHEAFAASRTCDFVYAETLDYMNFLTTFCCADAFSEPPTPLIITGPACCGKSSLLAHFAKSHATDPSNATSIFQHYAGASFDSVKLSFFLYRLMHGIKRAFGLKDFEVRK